MHFSATLFSVVGFLKPRFGVNDTLHGFSDDENLLFLIDVIGDKHQLLVESVACIAAKPKMECTKDRATILNHKKVMGLLVCFS